MSEQETIQTFFLLHVNDALFPIGGYSHSYGLETYIQQELVSNDKEAETYIKSRLAVNMKYGDLLMVRLAYEATCNHDVDRLMELEEMAEAAKIPKEIRNAAKKLGARFVKTTKGLSVSYQWDIYERYVEMRKGKTTSHSCAYGVFCASIGISLNETLKHYLYAQTSAMVTNCVKSIPLSQSVGQQILASCYPLMDKIVKEMDQIPEEMLYASTPGFDLRSIQHEHLYSRIYMS